MGYSTRGSAELIASSSRVCNPVVSMALRTCVFTMFVVMNSRAAISLFPSPSPMRATTS